MILIYSHEFWLHESDIETFNAIFRLPRDSIFSPTIHFIILRECNNDWLIIRWTNNILKGTIKPYVICFKTEIRVQLHSGLIQYDSSITVRLRFIRIFRNKLYVSFFQRYGRYWFIRGKPYGNSKRIRWLRLGDWYKWRPQSIPYFYHFKWKHFLLPAKAVQ